jgi:hypothetical protein
MQSDMFWIGILFGIVTGAIYLAAHVGLALIFRQGHVWLWRILSFVPLPLFAFVLVVTAQALQMNSNLWPILMIFYAPVEALYMGLLIGFYFIIQAARSAREPGITSHP